MGKTLINACDSQYIISGGIVNGKLKLKTTHFRIYKPWKLVVFILDHFTFNLIIIRVAKLSV